MSVRVRGSVVLYENPSVGTQFMFNPNDLKDAKGFSWNKTSVPRISHPVYQGGAGEARSITMTLYHDADRGRVGRSPGELATDGLPVNINDGDSGTGLDITNYLRFWRSLIYPDVQVNASTGVRLGVSPSKVLFNFGPFYDNLLCIVTQVDISDYVFTPNLTPMRANVSVTLEEAPDAPIFASDIRIGG